MIGVAPRTVNKWIDDGLLIGHRLPEKAKDTGEYRRPR